MDKLYKLVVKYINYGYSEEDAIILASQELDIDIEDED